MRRLLLAIVLSVAWVASCYPVASHALTSDGKRFVAADNTFYSYVKAGEKISVSFLRSQYIQKTGMPITDTTVTVDGPGMKQKKCVLKSDVRVGSGCTFAPIIAGKTGIWRIVFAPGKDAKPFEEASPDVRWQKNLFNWNVTVTGSDGEQRGRTWTEKYAFRQPDKAQLEATGDFTYFYVSEDGYIYKATDRQYDGQVSVLRADSIGIRKNDDCTSAYRSVGVTSTEYSPALGACGSRYKLFFEEPAGDLPTKATRWDDADDWVRPSISRPKLAELHFSPDKSQDQQSGTISFFLHNFIGQYDIKIDVDNDGSFDGQSDVALHEQMRSLSDGLQQVRFQGVDRQGQIIPRSQKIGIKVEITKVAEIHFVAVDVEGRGGIEVTRLNGDNAPTTRLCWNDTDLTPIADVRFMTKDVDGRNCPESGGGVHGWLYTSKSWGNARYIEDWIYASAKFDGNNKIVYPEDTVQAIKKSQTNWTLIMTIAAVVFIIVAIVAVIVFRKGGKTPPPAPLAPPGVQPIGSQDPTVIQPSDNDRY